MATISSKPTTSQIRPKRSAGGWSVNGNGSQRVISFNVEATKQNDAKIFENHLKPVMLLFIG